MDPQTLADCAVQAYRETAPRWELPDRPVVMDARETDAMATVGQLRAAGIPLLARIDGALPLTAADPAWREHNAEVSPPLSRWVSAPPEGA